MVKLPELCPKCQKKTEWLLITVEEFSVVQKPFLSQGLVPPWGIGAMSMVLFRKCKYCGAFVNMGNAMKDVVD